MTNPFESKVGPYNFPFRLAVGKNLGYQGMYTRDQRSVVQLSYLLTFVEAKTIFYLKSCDVELMGRHCMHCMREENEVRSALRRCCRLLSMRIRRPAEALMGSPLGIYLKVYLCKVTLDRVKELGRYGTCSCEICFRHSHMLFINYADN